MYKKVGNGNVTDQMLEDALKASLVNGKLPCVAAFEISRKLKNSTKEIGIMANKLGVKISGCQLGCFP